MKAVIIVAHPDDETIWAGGLMLQHADWQWTVLSLCRGDDADRAPKFHRVCEHLGAAAIISDLDDGNPPKNLDADAEIGGRIARLLPPGAWDLCLTHGANGEYGHPRHREINSQVVRLAANGTIACRRLWTFAYEADVAAKTCRPATWADETVELTPAQLTEKMHIVRDLYGYAADSFEVRACILPECFARVEAAAQGGA